MMQMRVEMNAAGFGTTLRVEVDADDRVRAFSPPLTCSDFRRGPGFGKRDRELERLCGTLGHRGSRGKSFGGLIRLFAAADDH